MRSRYKIVFLILIVCNIVVKFSAGQQNVESKKKIYYESSPEDEFVQDDCHPRHQAIEQNRNDMTITPYMLDQLRSMGAVPATSINSTCIRIFLDSLLRAMHIQSLTFDPACDQNINDSIRISSTDPSQYVLYCNNISIESIEEFVSPPVNGSNGRRTNSSDTYHGIILSNVPLNNYHVESYPTRLNINSTEYLSWTKSNLSSQLLIEWMQNVPTPFDQLKHLDLSNNKLTNLTWQMFDQMPELRILNLSHNSISNEHIQYKLFYHRFNQLRVLDLSNNEIKSIVHEKLYDVSVSDSSSKTNGLFVYMPDLHELNLNHNQISDLPRSAFVANALPKLHILNLANNQLSIIPFQIFQSLHTLQYLDLSSNRLVTILDNFFIENKALTALNLRNNMIEKILRNSLNGLVQLIEVDLSENHIASTDRSAFDSLTALQRLNLSQNNLTVIPTTLFQRSLQLKHLDLSRNPFKVLPNGIFENQHSLEHVIIDETNLIKLNNWVSRKSNVVKKDVLKHLRTISMRKNRHLQEIDAITFRSLPAVQYLDLSGNDLRILPSEIGELTELNHLNISQNRLISLTKQLNTLQYLQTIDMLGNSFECDCQMVWLTTWMNATRKRNNNSTQSEQRPPFNQLNELNCRHGYPGDFLRVLQQLQCFKPTILQLSESRTHLLHSDAQLDCSFSGNPTPDM